MTELSPSSADSSFPPHLFLFLSLYFSSSFQSIYWVTSWLPGGHPGASGASPGGGWVKCRCGRWFPLMKYQYFTPLIYCRLTKHDTILSKLGNVYVSVSPVFSPCDDKKIKPGQGFPLSYKIMHHYLLRNHCHTPKNADTALCLWTIFSKSKETGFFLSIKLVILKQFIVESRLLCEFTRFKSWGGIYWHSAKLG